MFQYNAESMESVDSIEIIDARIVEGKYDFIEGLYREVSWGQPQRMLYVEFDSLNKEIDSFYVSDNKFSIDFQHTTNQKQRIFFFSLREDMLLEEARIYGVKFDKEQSSLRLRPIGKVVGRSIQVKNAISLSLTDEKCSNKGIQPEPDSTEQQSTDLTQNGWVPVNEDKKLFISELLFQRGIISLFDPSHGQAPRIEANGAFAISKERSVFFSADKSLRRANQFFRLPDTVGLRHTNRRDECFVPVIVRDEQEKISAGLYIYPRRVEQGGLQTKSKPFTRFYVETCLYGFQLRFETNLGVRPLPKYSIEFMEGECVKAVSLYPGDNSYETMQLQELQLMATIMANYSLKGVGKELQAQVAHHLPWLDYIVSSALLWYQGHMTYQALLSLCEMMILKKIEQEQKVGAIYRSVGLASQCITPFDNLLNPEKALTAESILNQLGIDENEKESHQFFYNLQSSSDDTTNFQEKTLIKKYVMCLTGNAFNTEQQDWWQRVVTAKAASGTPIETLKDLLETANALAVAIAVSPHSDDAESSNACSFVSTQGKQIQVVYEQLFKSGKISLPPVTCWTSLPIFLTNSPVTQGTFYFNYLPHAKTLSKLIRHNIVEGAITNMAACMRGQEGCSVKDYLERDESRAYAKF